jgi:hypothetical protein
MSSDASISSDKLVRLIGPPLIDVRIDEDLAADPRLIPDATRRSHQDLRDWPPRLFFMHFRANGDAIKLAKGLRAALDKTASTKG